MDGRGTALADGVKLAAGMRCSLVGGCVELLEPGIEICERECERRRELCVVDVERDESVESVERDESGDQNELFVSEAARLRVDPTLREDAVLRIDAEFLAEFERESPRRGVAGFSGTTSGEGGGEGHGAGDTQLGSSSVLDEPSSKSELSLVSHIHEAGVPVRVDLACSISSSFDVLWEPSPCTIWTAALSISSSS